ncbi:MGDG synthase family glycosyltransferase [Cohnella yongneupensis]|uniref:Glycosyltransferase n=1 Tax=Cohnella yongneupensis TaxID=425006 RepID=A0ABW0R5G2_9BACL
MGRQIKLLIVYARFGDGHLQAATALSDSFARLGIAEAQIVDLLAQSHPLLNEVSKFVYRKSYDMFPHLYGWVYETTRDMKASSPFAHFLHSFGADELLKLIELERPDAIIHTFPSLALPLITTRLGRRIPMFNVVTDFDLHMRWVHPQVDKYYVATDDLRLQLNKLGIGDNRIKATGIPLRRSFAEQLSLSEREAVAARYGLTPDQPIVLLMAGAYGNFANLRNLCGKLSVQKNIQTIVVCGHNRSVQSELHRRFAMHANVTVLGYVDRIDELMRLAACIVTKPGGLTMSEAIEARLPIFLLRPVPGQERNNALYLQRQGAAFISRSIEELFQAILRLLRDSHHRLAMCRALERLSKESASDRIALDITNQLHIMEEASVPLIRG